MINKRLSSISCNETEFNKCKKEYEDALLDRENYEGMIEGRRGERPT